MPRLVTFGCSFAYGHGLPDCFKLPDRCGDTPSKLAWPQLVANKMYIECANKSNPGSGNLEILLNVLKTQYEPNDIVLISFSYFERFNNYKLIDEKGNSKRIESDVLEHKNLILAELGETYYKVKNYWDNWLSIHHCEQFLRNKGIKNFLFFGTPVGARYPKPDILKLENFIDTIPFIFKDKALDDRHPGTESHRLLSEIIYDKITQ